MTQPAAKEGDAIVATDMHLLNGTPSPLLFQGQIDGSLSANVLIENKPAAKLDSTATNAPAHVCPPGKTFDKPPTNRGVIVSGSGTVLINNLPAARNDDTGTTCNDPDDLPVGRVQAAGTVLVGG